MENKVEALKKQPPYRQGDKIPASVINNTVGATIAAYDKANSAVSEVQFAERNSQSAKVVAEKALIESKAAKTLSETANGNLATALNKLNKIDEVISRAESGGFDGNAALIPTTGFFGFQIVDGILKVIFSGDEPNLSINANGELTLRI